MSGRRSAVDEQEYERQMAATQRWHQAQAAAGIRPLHVIADEIHANWKQPYFGAVPYISAMRRLDTINDLYGADNAKSIVQHFLVNASTWRGEAARRVKAELKGMVK